MIRYLLLECIRQGNSSIIYKAWDLVTKEFVAIKMMGIHNTMEGVPSSMIREVSCLMELNHPNIIRLMRVASQGIYLYPVFEYQVNDLAYLLKYPKDSMNGYSTKVGTHYYKAPELLLGLLEYSTAVDIWPVVCIFGEMVSGKPLFPGVNSLITLGRIVGKSRKPSFCKLSLRDHLTNGFPDLEPARIDLISKMLGMDPDKRITAAEALQQEYFKDVPGRS
ncbi:cell division control protein 2-like [Citrus sinensis]|uniref:Cell division control protein 2-like n=1 Tax=Citrus sinensis TaxID=2711 RepID=A0ACB8N9F0_CITSI|nr:cell division control protein 2-like [Citrus sinensis]